MSERPADPSATGDKIRREVLGDEYVDAARLRSSEFMRPLQELVEEFAWGEVWGRDGIDRKTKSLINVAMIAALNREAELRLHVRGALRNGCTPEEIQEALLQATVYAGVPCGVASFRIANEVLEEDG
jgi:4-carboxymuconolactone decarboxylase